mmetsp:Transcript_27225/g.24116  ORF Transcript_27225/g.24116 Transcript_27225/m.24116 type:complete len:173 (+) Transcript_27225:224-742(+)
MIVKKRNDQMFDQKMKDKEEMMRIEEDNRARYFNDRVDRQVNKDNNIKAIKKGKREEFKLGKSMSVQNDYYRREFMATVQKRNNNKKMKVKKEEELRAKKLKELEEQKMKENQEAYYSRVEGERQKILDHEKKIKEMERMEAELLGRLKNSQQMEQSEYGKLEKALKASSEA